jgi:hypothetical protein
LIHDKIQNKTYYAVETVLKSDQKISETEAKLIPLTPKYMNACELSWLGTCTSIKGGRVKLIDFIQLNLIITD